MTPYYWRRFTRGGHSLAAPVGGSARRWMMAQPTRPDTGDDVLIDLPLWNDGLEDRPDGRDDELPFLGCVSTGQPCRLAPMPEGATTAISVQLPPDRPVYVTLRRVPADACLDCGEVTFDLVTLTTADAALARLLREDGTTSGTTSGASSWSLTAALRERLRAGIDYQELVPLIADDSTLTAAPHPSSRPSAL